MSEEIIENEAKQKPVKVWKRKNIHLVSEENDIRFRGPLSYRHLRIAGWLFLIIAQIGVILGLGIKINVIKVDDAFLTVLKSAGNLMTPLFLFAAFAQVLVAKDGYRRLLRTYILGAAGLYLLFILVYLHFGVGLMYSVLGNWKDAFWTVDTFVSLINSSGSLSFNIFIDLILCSLVTFFMNYRPTKYFQDKKIYIFRAFVTLPILYELGSITLKMLASGGLVSISPFLIPLLTTKPPVAFLIFIVLALFVKNREKFYIKHGKTHEEYKSFLNTNVNRLHFSLFLSFTIIAAVILDIVLFIVVFVFKLASYQGEVTDANASIIVDAMLKSTYSMGFGGCLPMILILPLIMFFDYTKTYKNKIVDVIIPVAGVALLILVYIEGLFEVFAGFLAELFKSSKEAASENEEAALERGLLPTIVREIKHLFNRR